MTTWKCPFCEEYNDMSTSVCHLCGKSNTAFKEDAGITASVKPPLPKPDSVPKPKKPLVTFESSTPEAAPVPTPKPVPPPAKTTPTPVPSAKTYTKEEEGLNVFLVILAFLIPIIGLIMGLSMSSRKKSKAAYTAAAIGFVINLLFILLAGS
jgi:hypothetical protein